MRLTSEQFADEMIKDMETPNNPTSFAEQLANMEKRINDRIAETEQAIFSKFDNLTAPEPTPEDVTEIEPDNNEDVTIETETIEEDKGE
ncbi:MAG: hypothetical protein IKU41_03030 [Clostridia bacterium]|nr:hypothetical protein [Clostridia bacterium]